MQGGRKKVFIDGSAGTTGLRIKDRLSARPDIELILLPEEERKNDEARREAIEASDISFLCLPDDAARETAEMMTDSDTVIIDTSTAHRTAEGWTYGFPELSGGAQRELIKKSKRISNPGCHASGFIALVAPLVECGLIKKDIELCCFSLTGYSGGGKKMIADYEKPELPEALAAPRQYGLMQSHKHLKEMQAVTGIETAPLFCPIVSSYYSGMQVSIPIFAKDISGGVEDIKHIYSKYSGMIKYCEHMDEEGFISASKMGGRDDMLISVVGNDERIVLMAVFDNLGKGASGAAIQNMNNVLGIDEGMGLIAEDL
ncbi:MAG: N-acetyl-gamma-glutamyl-phosphate reductase [Mogibacterium sp.]|nr:N-acetyl-gamma-glutamyl-phosphate reductase [Mogibacterium sp.]